MGDDDEPTVELHAYDRETDERVKLEDGELTSPTTTRLQRLKRTLGPIVRTIVGLVGVIVVSSGVAIYLGGGVVMTMVVAAGLVTAYYLYSK